LLLRLSAESNETWQKYSNAFRNLPSETKFKVLSCLLGFNKQFKDYLLNPTVLFSYSLDIVLTNSDSIQLFYDFILECEQRAFVPIFHRIGFPDPSQNLDATKLMEIYEALKRMGADQHKVMVRN